MTNGGQNRVRLLATDLDGTLLRSDNTVSDRTRDTLRTAPDRGLQIVLVTGRPTRWLWEVADASGYLGVVVSANGALTINLATEQILHADQLSPDDLARTTALLADRFPDVKFAMDSGDEFGYQDGYTHDWEMTAPLDRVGQPIDVPTPSGLDELVSRPCLKLLARSDGLTADEFWLTSSALLGDSVTVTRSATRPLLEISAAGVTKASGLARYCAGLGLSADEVAAVGDMPNDLPMLEWAGQSYAVANAHPLAKEAADEALAETNDQDAVALLIDRLLAANRPD